MELYSGRGESIDYCVLQKCLHVYIAGRQMYRYEGVGGWAGGWVGEWVYDISFTRYGGSNTPSSRLFLHHGFSNDTSQRK